MDTLNDYEILHRKNEKPAVLEIKLKDPTHIVVPYCWTDKKVILFCPEVLK